jgi:hypothetical protein
MAIQEIVRAHDQRHFGLLRVADLGELRSELRDITEPFVLFLALDANEVEDEGVETLALAADDAGITYLCAWGPDCERVHDRFDAAIVGRQVAAGSERFVMTTWHANDDLEDALWFFAELAQPSEEQASNLWLAVSVANDEWADRIARRLESGGAARG